jgi:mRNA interferase MazF
MGRLGRSAGKQVGSRGETARREEGAVRRGEVWWARLPGAAGRRPVVLVSREAAYAPARTRVTVVEVSRTIRGIPSEVVLGSRDGLPQRCAANADNIATVPKSYLEQRLANLTAERMQSLDEALRFSLGLI